MSFDVSFSVKFLKEYPNFPNEQQQAISNFVDTFLQFGLDFSKYKGKIAPSYRMQDKLSDNYDFVFKNKLWHYHLGLPRYVASNYGTYHTSDMILHFQNLSATTIKIVDVTSHYKVTGEFWLPTDDYLD
ncbi:MULTISPECIES: hypothetical protein [unclassified Moraxella]|uniref:hypothetical protein n=1 Tax=unclassified Moraxella TaxID=2685852 RepID=UPI003AF6E042